MRREKERETMKIAIDGPAGAGIFSEQMAAATITLEDLEDKKATH